MAERRPRRGTASFVLGAALLALFAAAAFFPGSFTLWGRKELFGLWEAPSALHPLGTNYLGYDVLAELVYGARDTVVIGLLSSVISLAIGAAAGVISAGEGRIASLFSWITQLFIMLPRLVSLIVLSAFWGSGRYTLALLIALFSWTGTARAVRAQVRHLKAQPFAEALEILGYSKARIALRHMLPNLSGVLLSRFLLSVNSCIMMESTLSFLGMGDIYHPTWGTMMNLAYRRGAFMRRAYLYLMAPGACVMLLSLAFYLMSVRAAAGKEIISQ